MLTRHHRIALVDPDRGRVLLVDGALPRHPDRWPSPRDLATAAGAPAAQVAAPPWRDPDGTITNVLVGATSSLPGARWVPLAAAGVPGLVAAVSGWAAGAPTDGRAPWFARGWLEEVVAWVDGLGVRRTGAPEPVKLWSLSAVLRIPAAGGSLFFKATCDGFRAEPVLTSLVREVAPHLAPPVVAVDAERAWMLMEPIAGADDGAPASRAPEIASLLAELQLSTRPALPSLLAAGAPHRGLDATVRMLATVVHDSVDTLTDDQRAAYPRVEAWLADQVRSLWDGSLPDTLAHGDLHLGNVAWVDRPVLFDWTDLCVTHPFLDARHLADSAAAESGPDADHDSVRAAVWTAYAEPWRAAYPSVDLDALWARTEVVNAVFHAVTFEQIYRAQPPASRWELSTVVGELLDGLVARHDAGC